MTTQPDNLPYPDYEDPADGPGGLQALADATQAALTDIRGDAAHSHPYAASSHTHAYAPSSHTHAYAPRAANTHYPAAGGVAAIVWQVGDLAAGQEKEHTITIAAGAFVLVSVQHHSTYIHAVGNLTDTQTLQLRCRNSTAQTPHTNVKVHVLIVVTG